MSFLFIVFKLTSYSKIFDLWTFLFYSIILAFFERIFSISWSESKKCNIVSETFFFSSSSSNCSSGKSSMKVPILLSILVFHTRVMISLVSIFHLIFSIEDIIPQVESFHFKSCLDKRRITLSDSTNKFRGSYKSSSVSVISIISVHLNKEQGGDWKSVSTKIVSNSKLAFWSTHKMPSFSQSFKVLK